MNSELLEFTRRALEKGVGRDELAEALKQAGWGEHDIRAASNAFAPIVFPIPVPRPRPYLSAREVFLYALLFITLYVSAWNLGSLIFHFVDLAYPDRQLPANWSGPFGLGATGEAARTAMRGNIAAILVAFPLFLFMFGLINRAIAKDPTKRESRPRKWLTYLTLFNAAALIIGDLSTLVFYVLGGDLTARFLFKVATIALIAGGAFAYFFLDIQKDERT